MQKKLLIDGMKCDGCASTVLNRLQSIGGVTEVAVSREHKTAVIKGNKDVSDDVIFQSLVDEKYNVLEIQEL